MWADPIARKYLLVINIPHFQDPDSSYSVDQLWHKDLQLHRNYISDLRLASPRRRGEAPVTIRVLKDEAGMGRLTHVPMPDPPSVPSSLLAVPRTFVRLWKAVGEAEVIHVGVGGWPYPLGWPAALIAKLRKKFLLVVVESAPWRLGLQPGASLKSKILGHVYERMARWSVNQADMALFTQAEYRSSLLRSGRPGLVTNASWIDDEVILSDAEADHAWNNKPASPLKMIFVGRVTESKGIHPLIEAIRTLDAAGVSAQVDFMGEGDQLEACQTLAASLQGATRVRVLPPVAYGAPFFETIRGYHAVLVPSLADEQPRIIYDAYSQAVPIIGSDTAGIRDCATDGETAMLVPTGDAAALARAIQHASQNVETLRQMGMAAVRIARKRTHAEMHRTRHELLKELLGSIPKLNHGSAPIDGSLQPSTAAN